MAVRAVAQDVRQQLFAKKTQSLKEIYERCVREYMAEAKVWNIIQDNMSTRKKDFNINRFPDNHYLGNLSREINTDASNKGDKSHAGSYCGTVSTYFDIVAAGIIGYTMPLSEFNIQFKIVGQRPETSPFPEQIKGAIEDLGRLITDLYLAPGASVEMQLTAAAHDLLRYGQCVLYDRFLDNGEYRLQTLDVRDFVFDTDTLTNEVYFIARRRATTGIGTDDGYDVWLKRSRDLYPGEDMIFMPYMRLVLDAHFNETYVEPLPFMPIRVCRLFPIPGYKFAHGYGQDIINEAAFVKTYTHLKTISSKRALTPPLENHDSEAAKDDEGKGLMEKLQNCELITRSPHIPVDQPLVVPIVTQNYQEIAVADAYYQSVIQRIQEKMLLSQYMLPEQPNMSAKEVSIRADQKSQLLAPVMSAFSNECIEPSIANITMHNLLRNRPLAMAIQEVFAKSGQRTMRLEHKTKFDTLKGFAKYNYGASAMEAVAMGMQMDPSVKHRIDAGGITVSQVANSGISQDLIRSPETAQALAEAEAKAMEQQAQQQQLIQAMQMAAKGNAS